MTFLVDPIAADAAVSQIVDWQSHYAGGASWLLVDAALGESDRAISLAKSWGWQTYPVFARSRLAAFGDKGPHLVSLPREADELNDRLTWLLQVYAATPAFSWLYSGKPADEICAALSVLGLVRVDGDLVLHCRFADTCVLTALWAVLTDEQWSWLAPSVTAWSCPDRAGGVLGLDVGHAMPDQPAMPLPEILELDAKQFAAVLDASEPDTVFSALQETTPELVPDGVRRSELHRQITQALGQATALQVTQAPDRLQFVVLSLQCGEEFYRHPVLAQTWAEVAQGAGLEALMQQWPAEVWEAFAPVEADIGALGVLERDR
ncbi:DUF4123 domain-containing protein [Ralstonia solanacearum]|uniref:DUF4123 domain-containing protein n=1 Tax=Ralstonia solanacearum TaxID=305 RepID=UPI00230657DF|nr:DUF4123 domain-containing protein [Ralstonia solanacearum]MDB0511937.1 DUF4123 domain-containing protein [Ralstonia solanacearum]